MQQDSLTLDNNRKDQLDSNIKKMLESGASNDDVMSYAGDFKNKFGVKKKDITQPDFQFGSQTSPFGSKPSQTQVDTSVPSVLLTDDQKKQADKERIGKRFETTLLDVPTEFGKVGRVMQAAKQVKETLPQAPEFRKLGEITRMPSTQMTEGQRLGESLTKGEDFKDVITDKLTNKKTGLQKQLENAENAFRIYQGDEIANAAQGYIRPEETLKIKEELGFGEKMSNQGKNFVNQLEKFPYNSALAIGQTLNALLGEDLGGSAYRSLNAGGDVNYHRMVAFNELDKLNAESKYSKGLIDSITDLDLPSAAAAVSGAVLSLIGTVITSAPTAGVGLYTDMVGGGLYDYNSTKANRLGISVNELYETGQNDFFAPAIIAGAGAQLEKIGLKGIKKGILSNLKSKSAQKAGLIFHNSNKEGVTEWAQVGLESYSNALAEGKNPIQAGEEAVKKMFSKEGAESYLMGAVASGAAIGGGRILKGLTSFKSKKVAAEVIDKIEQQQQEANNPEISEESRVFIWENIKNNVKQLVDVIDSDVEKTDNLNDTQKKEIFKLNKTIEALEVVANDPAVSEETKASAQTRIDEYNNRINEIESVTKTPSIADQPTQEDVLITPETSSNYANMTEDDKGNFVFFHVGAKGYDKIKPGTGASTVTSREEAAALSKVGGLGMYYTDPNQEERQSAAGAKYAVKIPKEKVYDFNTDKLNFIEEAKARHEAENPGKAFDINSQLAYVTKIAGDNGFDMVVAQWNNMTRAQTTKELTPTDIQESEGNVIKKAFNEKYESNKKKGFEPVVPVAKPERLSTLYDKINKIRNKEKRYDDLYRLYADSNKLEQDNITELINESDLPQEIKDEYRDILESKEETRRSQQTKPKEDAVQKQTAGQVPVLTEAKTGQEVEQGKPEPKAKGVTEEGKQEIKTTSAPKAEEQKLAESRKGGEVFPYKGEEYLIQKENEGEISAFSIVNKENVALETIPNKNLKSFQNPIAVSKEVVEKADITKPIIIGDTGSDYFVLDGNHRLTKAMLEGKDIQAYVLTPEQTKKIKLENGKAKKYKTETQQAEVTPKAETKAEPKVVTEKGGKAVGKTVKVKNAPTGNHLNIGLYEGRTKKKMSGKGVLSKLPKDVKVISFSEIKGTEPTLVVETSRPLTDAEMIKLLGDTKQQAIPQLSNGEGILYDTERGTKDGWGEFSPELFLLQDGKVLSEYKKTEGPELNESNVENAIELLDDIEDNRRKSERASSKRKAELDEKITKAETELYKISDEAQIVKAINDNFDKIKKDLKEQGLLNVKC